MEMEEDETTIMNAATESALPPGGKEVSNMTLLKTGQPLIIPHTQESGPMTEDMVCK